MKCHGGNCLMMGANWLKGTSLLLQYLNPMEPHFDHLWIKLCCNYDSCTLVSYF